MKERTIGLTDVVACVIKYATPTLNAPIQFSEQTDDSPSFLMGCRLPDKNYGGLWEFPGGQLQDGESLLTAAVRELKEELGLDLQTAANQSAFEIIIPGFCVRFLYVSVAGKVGKMTAHSEGKLIQLSKMDRYPLTPASAAFVIHLLQQR
ncbi:MAG: NUDIX domain-containing protein [Candidatus Brocadiales bacterium]|nr:NUDIX domain-containing protein [Candidatus Bathyanammoxibius sp.]